MEEKNQKSIEERQKELKEKILSLEIFTEIDKNLLNYQDRNIKTFLHTLCPKHINEMDEVINKTPIDTNELKKIIVDSIYDEFDAVLQQDYNNIIATPIGIDVDGNEISTSVDYDKHFVSRRTNNAYFGYVPEKDSYAYCNSNLCIQTCDDDNREILIKNYVKCVEQKITDNNLKKSAKECLVFLKSVSLAELKMYYQTFTQSITQTKEEEPPSHETIISAMQNAQQTVEETRKKEEEKEEKKNGDKDIKEEQTESIKNNTTNTGFDNNNSWKDWFKTTPPFSCCYSCCYSLCNSENQEKSVN